MLQIQDNNVSLQHQVFSLKSYEGWKKDLQERKTLLDAGFFFIFILVWEGDFI